VLMQALERYEQGNLPRSMQLWIQELLEIQAPSKAPSASPAAEPSGWLAMS
jgi:hypothetical protein